jgi:ABC-type multidrug transport system fused ATPase/permease subunit
MAETGTISNIIGVIGAGTRVSFTLFQFGASIGSAGTEARTIGTEITLFCSVLKQLQSTFTNARSFRQSISAIDTIHEVLDQCQEIFKDIESIIDGLQKRKAATLEPSSQFISRVRWTSKKSKLQLLRTRLESCKITLHIMLTTLDFAQKIATRK